MSDAANLPSAPHTQLVIPHEDGLYLDVPASEYHRWPLCNNSALTAMDQSCPRQMDYDRRNPPDPTDSKEFGDAAHLVILQPDLLEAKYMLVPKCQAIKADGDRCTHDASIAATDGNWYCGTHAKKKTPVEAGIAKQTLTQKEWDALVGIRDSVYSDPRAKAYLEHHNRIIESTAIVTDPEFGIRCKSRHDLLCPANGLCLDLKSTRSIKQFRYSLFKYGYHRQGAFYLDNLGRLHLMPTPAADAYDNFGLLLFEKNPPYCTHVVVLHPSDVDWGRSDVKRLKALYARCEKAGHWPNFGWDWSEQRYNVEAIELNEFDRRKIQEEIDKGISYADPTTESSGTE